MEETNYFIYCLCNRYNTVLYIGVTNNLQRRVYEHKNKLVAGFTQKYNVNKLVYFEQATDVYSALMREKQLKGLSRQKKNALITKCNPDWLELYIG